MHVRAIAQKISPVRIYRNAVQKRQDKVAAEAERVFLQNNPEIAERRRVLREFLSKPKTEYKPTGEDMTRAELNFGVASSKASADSIIESCGNNLPKIEFLTGEYGLARWARQDASKVVRHPNPEIKETGIGDGDSMYHAFCEFVVANPAGRNADLIDRLGEYGRAIQRGYQRLGFMN